MKGVPTTRIVSLYLVPSFLLQLGLLLFATFKLPLDASLVVPAAGIFVSLLYAAVLYSLGSPLAIQMPHYTMVLAVIGLGILVSGMHYGLYYALSGDFFAPDRPDTVSYHNWAIALMENDFWHGIEEYLDRGLIGELGTILYVRMVYTIVAHPLAIGVANTVVGAITAIMLFKTMVYYMPRNLALFFAGAFAASPMLLTFNSSNFKEPMLLLLVVTSYYCVASFTHGGKLKFLILLIPLLAVLMTFRSVLSGMLVLSLLVHVVRRGTMSRPTKVVVLSLLVLLLAQLSSLVLFAIRRFSLGDVQRLMSVREAGMEAGGNALLAFLSSLVSQAVGPIPRTLITTTNKVAAFNAPGLLFRYFTSLLFLLGIFEIIRNKERKLYPLLLFIVMHSTALALILRGFDLRFALPHMPLVYLVSGYFVGKRQQFLVTRANLGLVTSFVAVALLVAVLYNIRGL